MTDEQTKTPDKTDKKPKFFAHTIQREWLDKAQGKEIEVHLRDGDGLTGILLGHDMYCLAIQQPGQPEPALVYKQALAYLARSEA